MPKFEMLRERKPCIYDLSFEFNKVDVPVFKIKLHREFVEKYANTYPEIINCIKREHDLGGFMLFPSRCFGFNGRMKAIDCSKDFIFYEIEIPSLFEDKTQKYATWKPIIEVSGTLDILNILFNNFPFKEIDSEECQLFTAEICSPRERFGSFIGGILSVDFCEWLNSLPDDYDLRYITETMIKFWKYLWRENMISDFNAYVQKGAFVVINCPGDACINTDHYWKEGEGVEYSGHNVDSPAQQLTLLVGVSMLAKMAKKDIYKNK